MTAETVAKALGGRKSGNTWMGLCPAHDDKNPSLSVKGESGKVLVHCHAGCDQRDVIEALKHRRLWVTDPPIGQERQRLSPVKMAYDYCDERGQLLYQITRHEPMPPDELKPFRQRYPDAYGNWVWKKHSRQVLYRLPEVIEAPIVFVVEGEKDADSLRAHGFVATTAAGGADAQWLPSFTRALRGHEVILIPDADEPGRRRVLRIAHELLGNAAKIVIVDLDGAKDVSDWFDAAHSELELIRKVERLGH